MPRKASCIFLIYFYSQIFKTKASFRKTTQKLSTLTFSRLMMLLYLNYFHEQGIISPSVNPTNPDFAYEHELQRAQTTEQSSGLSL